MTAEEWDETLREMRDEVLEEIRRREQKQKLDDLNQAYLLARTRAATPDAIVPLAKEWLCSPRDADGSMEVERFIGSLRR